MPTNASRWAYERRAYYRLLRHLLSEEVQSSYADDRTEPLPDRLSGLLETLEHRAPSEKH